MDADEEDHDLREGVRDPLDRDPAGAAEADEGAVGDDEQAGDDDAPDRREVTKARSGAHTWIPAMKIAAAAVADVVAATAAQRSSASVLSPARGRNRYSTPSRNRPPTPVRNVSAAIAALEIPTA
jgi:hypothetical protein